jgi:hypothetical protein
MHNGADIRILKSTSEEKGVNVLDIYQLYAFEKMVGSACNMNVCNAAHSISEE